MGRLLVKKRLPVLLIFCCLFFAVIVGYAQPTGYYNGTEGLSGEALKQALHNIISPHFYDQNWYSNVKYTFLESDADPNNAGNVIDVYSGNSMDGLNYGTQAGTLNREHVWAKSHGSFPEDSPMYSDRHNLKPCEAQINRDRNNLDFDWSNIAHPTATGSRYDNDSWEPRDAVKGDIARIIFYMATRYEGTNGEPDLEVSDWTNTYPMPKHGKLSALFAWHLLDPPDDFERNRNDVIYSEQGNRNPFIDHPEWVSMIWGNATPAPIQIDNFEQSPQFSGAGNPVEIRCTITNESPNAVVKIRWDNRFAPLTNEAEMVKTNGQWVGFIPAQRLHENVYYQVQVADNESITNSVCYHYTTVGVSISEESPLTAEQVWLYPNPAGTYLSITLPDGCPKPEQLKFYDLNGRLHHAIPWTSDSQTLRYNLSKLPAGWWMITLYHNDYQIIKKFFKQ